MLTNERIDAVLAAVVGADGLHAEWLQDVGRPCARAIEAEVRKEYGALIRQLKKALESCGEDDNGEEMEKYFDSDAVQAAITAAHALLVDREGGEHA